MCSRRRARDSSALRQLGFRWSFSRVSTSGTLRRYSTSRIVMTTLGERELGDLGQVGRVSSEQAVLPPSHARAGAPPWPGTSCPVRGRSVVDNGRVGLVTERAAESGDAPSCGSRAYFAVFVRIRKIQVVWPTSGPRGRSIPRSTPSPRLHDVLRDRLRRNVQPRDAEASTASELFDGRQTAASSPHSQCLDEAALTSGHELHRPALAPRLAALLPIVACLTFRTSRRSEVAMHANRAIITADGIVAESAPAGVSGHDVRGRRSRRTARRATSPRWPARPTSRRARTP